MSSIPKNKLQLPFVILFFLQLSLIQTDVDAQTFSTQSSSTFPTPLAPARVSVGDFDNDDDGDILYQTGADNTVFRFARSNGDGTFTDEAISTSPFAGVTLVNHNGSNYHVADFDRDGDVDVWAGVNNTTGSYYRNDNGTFTLQSSSTFPAPAVSSRAVAGDFDIDGDADFLYQTAGNGTSFQYARSNGNGTFTIVSQASSPFAGVGTLIDNNGSNYHVADFDGDGDVDVWAGVNNSTGSYYRNDNGTFTLQSSASFPAPLGSSRVVVSDYDTDGDADILYQTGSNGTPFQYARSNGDGSFTIISQSSSPFASVTLIDHTGSNYYVEDFDNDDDFDVWAAVSGNSGSFYSKDDAPPYLVDFTPANNSSGVSTSVNITYTFSENVVKGLGNITIVRTFDNTIEEVIPVVSAQVTGSGTSWTINPSITLAGSTQYSIKSDASTFKNADGVVFGGVSLSNVQSFTTAMTLNSVSVPADGNYTTGDNLDFSVSFSEIVNVSTIGGNPYIQITVGSDIKNTTYISGSGTNSLTFRYIVAPGDFDNDGIAVGSDIVLNGGTIKNGAGTVDAPLALINVGTTSGVLVGTITPVEICDGIDNNGDGNIDEGFDSDGDGLTTCQGDCDDSDPNIQAPVLYYVDDDRDGYGSTTTAMVCSATAPAGYATNNSDCDDNDANIQAPVQYYVDGDHDGYGSTITAMACAVTPPLGYSTNNIDCDDNDASVYTNCGICMNAASFSTTNITSTSAQLNWVASANPVQWQLQYKSKAPGSKWIDVFIVGTARSYTIPGLKPNQNYNWHIRAKCGTAWTSYSKSISFKTTSATSSAVYQNNLNVNELLVKNDLVLKVKVYPNPATSYFNLVIQSSSNAIVTVRIMNAAGRIIEQKNGIAANSTQRIGSNYVAGVYYVQVLQNGNAVTLKLIKQAQ